MNPNTKREIEALGRELRASHDDAKIADVIGEVERLEAKSADITAEILRIMVGAAE